MTIYYKHYGDIITEAQAMQNGSYEKVFEENGIIKYEEVYFNGSYYNYHYYISPSETETQVKADLISKGHEMFAIIKIEPVGSNTLRTYRGWYDKGTKMEPTTDIQLLDAKGNLLFWQDISNITNLPKHTQTEKNFYDYSILDDGEPIFKARYDSDGFILYMDYFSAIDEQSAIRWYPGDDFSGIPDLLGITQAEFDWYLHPNL